MCFDCFQLSDPSIDTSARSRTAHSYSLLPRTEGDQHELTTWLNEFSSTTSVRDRWWRLKKFKHAFKGKHFIAWLQTKNYAKNETVASDVANRCLDAGLIRSVSGVSNIESNNELFVLTGDENRGPSVAQVQYKAGEALYHGVLLQKGTR